ncbi:restriction endonuclease [Sporomusa sphaeroides]|uniref:Mrr restriction system protein n=1 Tax=Sporomusa sphaeroides DSM 2875 TaxID=1337886 RepID=A0ABP2CCD5_9FIRM|nr:restriction endonuclease [Sporomusa sphaeroides]OLS54741.1 Mrr restriction system protein [Sporomusa sphaeroides DSM 2875]CVK20110.1 Mrr restriction system protein [Sporomusa sphaeroides DSM 2875]
MDENNDNDKTPLEMLHNYHQELRNALADELLQQIDDQSPKFFERLVMDLLLKMGYGGSREDAQVVGKSGDEGSDGIIKEDRLGLDVIHVQVKRWKNSVGNPELQGFIGASATEGCA